MNAATTPGIGSAPRPALANPVAVLALAAFAVVTAAATAYLTTSSLRTAATMVLLLVVIGAYVRSRRAGLIAMWLVWMFSPGLRRILTLAEAGQYSNADPLALLPFLATGLMGFEAIRSGVFSTRAKWIMGLAAAGWALGLPAGLHSLNSAVFAFVAYVTGVTAFAIGYQERPRKLHDLTLYRVLIFAVPAIAIYGLIQYFVVMPGWDGLWLTTVDFVTANAPQAGHARVFSLLNSPGTCAAVLGLGLVCYLITQRVTLASVTAVVLVVACLSVTFVRSAWFAVVVAMLAFVLASRGTALRRVIPLVAVIVLAFSGLSSANGTAKAVIDRVSTFGSLSSDTSANARLDTPTALVPIAISTPLGAGLGQAGESARLGASPFLRNADNGYLALIYQTGPMGFLLVMGAALLAFSSSVRRAFRRGARRGDLLVFTLLTFEFIDLLSGDAFYGVLGVAFWYLLGVGVSAEEDRVDVDQAVAGPSPHSARPVQLKPASGPAR